MGKNKKKEYVLDAVLDEETYMAYKSGQAIDNNGLRSPKGSYWPKQPSYREKNHIKESGLARTWLLVQPTMLSLALGCPW